MSTVHDVTKRPGLAAAQGALEKVAVRARSLDLPGPSPTDIERVAQLVEAAERGATQATRDEAMAGIDEWRLTRLAALGDVGPHPAAAADDALRRLVDSTAEELAVRAQREGLSADYLVGAATQMHYRMPGYAAGGRAGRRRAKRAIAAWRQRVLAAQDVELRRRERESRS